MLKTNWRQKEEKYFVLIVIIKRKKTENEKTLIKSEEQKTYNNFRPIILFIGLIDLSTD